MQIVRPAQWVTQPWRNGGGITHEVLREGPADAFTLRISVADVDRAGPFSRFPGIERWITLLEGKGFTLHRGEVSHRIDQPFVPFRFSGNDAIDCTLVEGPVRDLNVMFAPDAMRLDLSVIVVREPIEVEPPPGATRLLVFALDGGLELSGAWLERHELLATHAATIELSAPATALVIWIGPPRGR